MLNLDDKLNKLSQINSNEDIKSLSYAIFPGTHCPLFGVAMIASFISDLAVLVVGTSECTYYSKGFAYQNQKGEDNFYSLVISKKELTFGCSKIILNALKQIETEDKPSAIMIVTTCVLEVIGEDVESLIFENKDAFSAHILVVKTEHFKCGSHIPGMERALLSLANVMQNRKKNDRSINILGHRKHGVESTEVIKTLNDNNITIHSIIPSCSTIKDIEKAGMAALNVVTDFTALPLAVEMEKTLNTPYVYFGRHLSLEKIDIEYKKIEEIFDIDIINQLQDKREALINLENETKQLFKDKSFIYGNTPMMAFEVSDYLASLGLNPLFIQVREYYTQERADMDSLIARGLNPYVSSIANIAPMQEVYDILKPDIYIGHENPIALFKKGILQITVDEVTTKIGYEVTIEFLKKIIYIYEQAKKSPDVPAGMLSMMGMMGMSSDTNNNENNLKDIDTWLSELEQINNHSVKKDESSLNSDMLTPAMARAVDKGMPLAIAKMVSKRGNKE